MLRVPVSDADLGVLGGLTEVVLKNHALQAVRPLERRALCHKVHDHLWNVALEVQRSGEKQLCTNQRKRGTA